MVFPVHGSCVLVQHRCHRRVVGLDGGSTVDSGLGYYNTLVKCKGNTVVVVKCIQIPVSCHC